MVVLGIVGSLVVIFLIFVMYSYLNDYSIDKFDYEFYSVAHLIQIIIADWIIYFGNSMYIKAVKNNGDALNGQLLIFIGVVIILIVMYKNFKYVPFFTALILSILQLLISIPLAAGALFVLFIGLAALSQTKPVFVLND